MTDAIEAVTEITPTHEATFSEAPYSGNVRTRIHGYDWQLTIRAANSSEFIKKIDGLMTWLDQRTDKALNVETPTVTATTVPPAPAAPATAAPTVQTIHAVKLQVAPRADGKIDLNFFEAGHQYADIKATKTPADAALLLQPLGGWTPQHFAAAAEYVISAAIDWKPSANLNKNGKPYKNIVTVSPA